MSTTRSVIAATALALSLAGSVPTQAQTYGPITGEVVLPFWSASNTGIGGMLIMTNTGQSPVTLSVTFYTSNGTVSTCSHVYTGFSNGNTTLDAGKGASITINCPSHLWGWAKIVYSRPWGSEPSVHAFGYRSVTGTGTFSEFTTPVNEGRPF